MADLTILEDRHAVGDRHRFLLVMRHVDQRLSELALDALQLAPGLPLAVWRRAPTSDRPSDDTARSRQKRQSKRKGNSIKVLVVEDEGLVALMIEDILQDLGCEIVASVAHLADACVIAAKAPIDLAVLDVNLGGERSFPVAEILRDRGVPFLFSTGYETDGIPAEFNGYPVLGKPFSAKDLQQTISRALQAHNAAKEGCLGDQLRSSAGSPH
jgi:CheY-like chemotaxis protein